MKFASIVLVAATAASPLASAKNSRRHLQIDPSTVDINLPAGGTTDVGKTISTTEVPQNLEFCLLSDATGSFSNDQPNLRLAAPGIATTIVSESPGAKFGYAAFKDTGDNFVYRLLQSLTTTTSDWITAINNLSPSGGGDFPEAQWDGITCAVEGCTYGASCGFSSTSDPSRKVLVVTTDATFSNDPDIINNQASTTSALLNAGVTLIGLKAGSAGGELDILASATGGSIQALSSDGSNIANAILDGLAALPATVTVQPPVCDDGLSVSFDATSKEVTSGQDASFTETIQVGASPVPSCDLACAVTFLSNGVEVGTQTIDVTVVGQPTITCPDNIVVSNDPGQCGAVVGYGVTADDSCPLPEGALSQQSGIVSGGFFPVGTTTNMWQVTDAEGNTVACSFDVTVLDTEPPAIMCPGPIVVGNDATQCNAIVDYIVTASDNCPGHSLMQTAGQASGTAFDVGTTTNTWEVTDSAGNLVSCTFDVTVEDVEPPVAACEPGTNPDGNTPPANNQDGFFTIFGMDNCDDQAAIEAIVWDSGLDGTASTGDDWAFSVIFGVGGNFKYVEAPGAPNKEKEGSGEVEWKLTGNGDAYLVLTDTEGNPSTPTFCFVPPPPARKLRGNDLK